MKVLIILVIFTSSTAFADDNQARVATGTNAKNGEVKCYTTLNIFFEDAIKTCGGCLISETKVVTAANCLTSLDDAMTNRITFAFGRSRAVTRGLGFTKIQFVDGYDPIKRNFTNDLAIITLNGTVKSNRNRGPSIPSTNSTTDAYVGQRLFVCGFGNIDNNRKRPGVLQCTYLKVINAAECASTATTTAASTSTTTSAATSAPASTTTTTTTAGTTTTTTAGSTTTTTSGPTTTVIATTATPSTGGGIICTQNIDDSNVCHGDQGSPVFASTGSTLEWVGVVSIFPDVRPNARCQDGHKVLVTQVGSFSSFLKP